MEEEVVVALRSYDGGRREAFKALQRNTIRGGGGDGDSTKEFKRDVLKASSNIDAENLGFQFNRIIKCGSPSSSSSSSETTTTITTTTTTTAAASGIWSRNQVKALRESKRKMEDKYSVRISDEAFDLVLRKFRTFDSEFIFADDDLTPQKSVEIMEGACKLVVERFKTYAHETAFYDNAYQLRRSLVELLELHRDLNRDSQCWVARLKRERDAASNFMSDFLRSWDVVLRTTGGGYGMFPQQLADLVPIYKEYGSRIAGLNKCTSDELPTTSRHDVAEFLNDINDQIFRHFGSLLTVEACHIAEVVSNLSDVPPTLILPLINYQKQKAMYMTVQRVVNQEIVVREIFETLASPRMSTTRPRGSFILLGTSGVGKTEIAKAVAEHWYCDPSRLVEIDLSDYAEPQLESAVCDLSDCAREKHHGLWSRLCEAVSKRPYSVILMRKIDKASSSVRRVLLDILNNEAPNAFEGGLVDFSKSIIFMTLSVKPEQLELDCKCQNRNEDLRKQFLRNPVKFRKNHDCTLKARGPHRALFEARKFVSDDLLDSVDNTCIVKRFNYHKAVFRLLLREIVRELTGQTLIVHASNEALDLLFWKASRQYVGGGKAFKNSLLQHVIPRLPAAEDHKIIVVWVDTLVGTRELSFRFQTHEQFVDDWYFKLKDGTFVDSITNLRMKLEAVHRIINLRSRGLPLLDCIGLGSPLLGQSLLDICNEILMWSPFPDPPGQLLYEKETSCNLVSNYLPTVEEVEEIRNLLKRLEENDTGLAKATSVIVNAVLKIIDAQLQLTDLPARYYLFLGLGDDTKVGLIDCLTESLRTGSGKSLFSYIKLDNDCRGNEVKKLLIKEVKEKPCMVFLLDGVELADDLLYRSVLEICDKGTLDDSEGFRVDFRKTILILTSTVGNKGRIAEQFNYLPHFWHSMTGNQSVKRFRSELVHRVEEIILFDPLLPAHGDIRRLSIHDGYLNGVLKKLFLAY